MLTIEEARARVQKGAAYLDGVSPGWVDRVNVNTLIMRSPCRCVIGQLSGHYSQHFNAWFSSVAHAMALGFDAPVSECHDEEEADYRLLQGVWVDAIAARRFPVVDPPAVETPIPVEV